MARPPCPTRYEANTSIATVVLSIEDTGPFVVAQFFSLDDLSFQSFRAVPEPTSLFSASFGMLILGGCAAGFPRRASRTIAD
jgi:hypothetical protein